MGALIVGGAIVGLIALLIGGRGIIVGLIALAWIAHDPLNFLLWFCGGFAVMYAWLYLRQEIEGW